MILYTAALKRGTTVVMNVFNGNYHDAVMTGDTLMHPKGSGIFFFFLNLAHICPGLLWDCTLVHGGDVLVCKVYQH